MKIRYLLKLLFAFLLIPLNIYGEIRTELISEETCNGKDGAARVILPEGSSNYYTVTWFFPDGTTANGLSIYGLEAGNYVAQVRPAICNDKIIYEGSVDVPKKDCSISVNISVSTFSVPCDVKPTARLYATASGGVGDYTYEWRIKDVSSSGYYSCVVYDSLGNQGIGFVEVFLKEQECAQDPNEIAGPDGSNEIDRFVSAVDKMNYTISFENDSNFATAPASRVTVTYPVPSQQKISSFRLADFGFGDFVFTVPSNVTSYAKRIDVSDSLGVWVDVTAGVDIVNNNLFWIFQSVDPSTGFEPASSQMGFLPINDERSRGEGYVSFYINPEDSLKTGDTVAVDASIVFDENAPIMTNVWKNTIDAVAPSSVLSVTLNNTDSLSCSFSCVVHDDLGGSGVNNIEIYMSEDGKEYTSIGMFQPDSVFYRNLESGKYYSFISIATDSVGNKESFKSTPDVIINNNMAPTNILLTGNYFYENSPMGTSFGTFTTIDNDINLPFVYELVDSIGKYDNNMFAIKDNQLVTNYQFSCYGRYEYNIRVKSTDISGLSMEKTFSISMIPEVTTKYATRYATICQGDSMQFGQRMLSVANTYTDTLITPSGCDSVVTLHLTVLPLYFNEEIAYVCDNEIYEWTNHTVEIPNLPVGVYTYWDSLTSVSGCDSIYKLTLIVNPTYFYEEYAETCKDVPYVWENHSINSKDLAVGTHILWDSLTTVSGCDSIYKLNLTVKDDIIIDIVTAACGSYVWNNKTYTESGDYVNTFAAANACDSIVTVHLTINKPPYIIISGDSSVTEGESVMLTALGGVSYLWNTEETTSSILVSPSVNTLYIVEGTDANNCSSYDSILVSVSEMVNEKDINTALSNSLELYPNPASKYVTLKVENQNLMIEKVEMFDIMGTKIMEIPVDATAFERRIDVSSILSGVYLVQISSYDGSVAVKKLLIKRPLIE